MSEQESLTFEETRKEAEKFSVGLGPSVGIICAKNSPSSVIAYFGFLSAGIVPMFVDPQISETALKQIIEGYKARYVALGKGTRLSGFRIVRERGELSLLEARESSEPEIHPELLLLQLTSGSTGSPKAVRISRDNVQQVSGAIARYMEMVPHRRFFTHLPFHYVYGLSIVNLAASVGASLFFTEHSFLKRNFWDSGRNNLVTDFSGVPFHYEALDRLNARADFFEGFECFTQAGGRLHSKLVDKYFQLFQNMGIDFFVMYGQAEASPRMSFLGPSHPGKAIGSVGRAIDIGRFSISSEEIVYHGRNVCLGYASGVEDLALGDVFRGALRTGDLGFLDENGNLHIRGRAKRMVKILGESIYLDEVESILRKYFDEVAVVGKEDDLVVVSRPENEITAEKLRALLPFVRGRYLRVHTVSQLPINSSGKIDYLALEDSCL